MTTRTPKDRDGLSTVIGKGAVSQAGRGRSRLPKVRISLHTESRAHRRLPATGHDYRHQDRPCSPYAPLGPALGALSAVR